MAFNIIHVYNILYALSVNLYLMYFVYVLCCKIKLLPQHPRCCYHIKQHAIKYHLVYDFEQLFRHSPETLTVFRWFNLILKHFKPFVKIIHTTLYGLNLQMDILHGKVLQKKGLIWIHGYIAGNSICFKIAQNISVSLIIENTCLYFTAPNWYLDNKSLS